MKIPDQQWQPVDRGAGGPLSVEGAVKALDVENRPRYAPSKGVTWCNIFAWDVSVLVGSEVPHWHNERTGEPCAVRYGREMRANDISSWMRTFGVGRGWRSVPRLVAGSIARQGGLVLAVWSNPNGIGHVAVVLDTDRIAQAGARNFSSGTVRDGFGSAAGALEFFAHA